jgi:predicted ATP-grasp superfamily ATP-dependent carboligase
MLPDILESSFIPKEEDIIINWGNSRSKEYLENLIVINRPRAVLRTVDKRETFFLLGLAGIPTLTYTRNILDAYDWVRDGKEVFCRTEVSGHSGSGITISSKMEDIIECPLYTLGEDIKREYRVHIFNSSCIDFTIKALRKEEEPNKIQAWKNGYVFVRDSVKVPERIRENAINIAIDSLQCLGLDFGAVDIIRTTDDILKVIEINSAPGIEGTSLGRYVEAFNTLKNNRG